MTLKYRTTKAAEVSRLIHAALGRLGRSMAALPDVPEVEMPDAGDAVEEPAAVEKQTTQGGKKKKKGKK